MMPNVTRGTRMVGLMRYLVGPGKANEHTNPHLVGGDDVLMSWFGREELSMGDAHLVARHLDAPRVEASARLGTRADAGAGVVKGGHVWHCSLSLAASEGELSDEKWQQIASDFMAQMQWRVDAAETGTSLDRIGAQAAQSSALVGTGAAQSAGSTGSSRLSVRSARGEVLVVDVDAPGATSGAPSGSSTGRASQAEERGAAVGSTSVSLRWAAVRHGASKNGNDHVHLVVNLVAEGGAVANPYRDFLRAQSAARVLETEHGLTPLPSATRGLATRGWKPAEQAAAARRAAVATAETQRLNSSVGYAGASMSRGWSDLDAAARKAAITGATKSAGGALGEALGVDQPRRVLEVAVRGASAASRSEDEFVRRLREAGVLVRPRFAEGSTRDGQAQVTGFSVALRPRYSSSLGEHPVWYGGGTLARDLTLPRLRQGWENTGTPSGTTSEAAAAEWRAAARARRSVAPASSRRESKAIPAHAVGVQAKKVAAMSRNLAQVPAHQRLAWSKVAGQSAGALSAWAMAAARSSDAQVAAMAPTLAAASQTLSVSASTVGAQPASTTLGTTSMSGMAMLLASAARGGQGAAAQAILVTQMISLVESVIRMAAERRELDTVLALREGVQTRLVQVQEALAQHTRAASPIAPGTSEGPARSAITGRPSPAHEERARSTRGPQQGEAAPAAAAPGGAASPARSDSADGDGRTGRGARVRPGMRPVVGAPGPSGGRKATARATWGRPATATQAPGTGPGQSAVQSSAQAPSQRLAQAPAQGPAQGPIQTSASAPVPADAQMPGAAVSGATAQGGGTTSEPVHRHREESQRLELEALSDLAAQQAAQDREQGYEYE